jgi:hypothetical protein
MDIQAALTQAIAAAKAGRRAEARHLLENILDQDERNEQAWLWLSGVVDDQEDRIICLENVLTINRRNETARKGLAALQANVALEGSASPPQLPIEPREPLPTSSDDRRVYIGITIVLLILLICIVFSIVVFVIVTPTG